MTQENFIAHLKEAMESQAIPPHYNPDEWEGKNFNCYAYALRLCMQTNGIQMAPGLISKERRSNYRFAKKEILQYLKQDCEVLGLQVNPTSIDEPINSNAYKIAIYVREGWDFHFVRQDSNGNWSEKYGWTGEIKTLPQESVTKDRDGYEFVGVFKVSKK